MLYIIGVLLVVILLPIAIISAVICWDIFLIFVEHIEDRVLKRYNKEE